MAAALNSGVEGDRWKVEVRELGLQINPSGPDTIGVSPNCWRINVNAAKENLEEQAAWLAGIAISLIRLAAGPSLGQLGGKFGEPEPHPFRVSSGVITAITASEHGISTGAESIPPRYIISEDTVSTCARAEFQDIVLKVFSPSKKSIGQRMA